MGPIERLNIQLQYKHTFKYLWRTNKTYYAQATGESAVRRATSFRTLRCDRNATEILFACVGLSTVWRVARQHADLR